MVYGQKGRYDQAISDCSKALEINPRLASAYSGRAVAYYHKGKYDKAWTDVSKAQALEYEVDADFLKALQEASGKEK